MTTVNITMGDLIRFNAVEFARPRRLFGYLVALALMIGAFLIAKHGWPQSSRNWFALAAGMNAFAQQAERLRDPGSTEQMVRTRGG